MSADEPNAPAATAAPLAAVQQPSDASGPTASAWPAAVALGLTTMAAGLVAGLSVWTSQVRLSFFLFGATFFVLGLGGWIKELRDEGRHGE